MRKRQLFFRPFPGIPCAGNFPRRASPNRVLRGMSRNDAARSALTNGSGVAGEEAIEFCTMHLTHNTPSGGVLERPPGIQQRPGSARQMEDTNLSAPCEVQICEGVCRFRTLPVTQSLTAKQKQGGAKNARPGPTSRRSGGRPKERAFSGRSDERRPRAKRSCVFGTCRACHSGLPPSLCSFCSVFLWVRFFLRFAPG